MMQNLDIRSLMKLKLLSFGMSEICKTFISGEFLDDLKFDNKLTTRSNILDSDLFVVIPEPNLN